MGKGLEQTLGVLNGAVGDYLARTGNGLATEMALYLRGARVEPTGAGLAQAYPEATGRAVLLVHGLMCTEDVWALPDGSDYGSLLARDLGFTPLYLRYNSGLAIPDNGAALAALLEQLGSAWPGRLEELLLLGYSMGGLVVRSACHVARQAGHGWLGRVRQALYVGTPHQGAPLERAGRALARLLRAVDDPYTRLIADLANLRSAGIQDLGDAVLRHQDRAPAGPGLGDASHPVPLLPELRHGLVAGALSADPGLAALFGDAVVPLASATFARPAGQAALPPERVKVLPGLSHLDLAHHSDVYAQLRAWAEEAT